MYTGMTGALKVVNALGIPSPVAYISGWSVEGKTEMIERTKVGEVGRQIVPGFQSWSASANGTVYFDGAGGHDELFAAQYNGTKLLFHFYLNDGKITPSGKNTYFCGEGYIETMSIDLSAEDKGNISISVAGTGALELYVDDKNVMTGAEHKQKETIEFNIDDNGILYANVPDEFKDDVWKDERGHLIVRL